MKETNSEELADFHFWRAFNLKYDEIKGIGRPRPKEAKSHLLTALEYEPRHIMASIVLGELHLFSAEELGMNDADALKVALDSFQNALNVEPNSADAWSGKALTLLYTEKFAEALSAAESGLAVLPLRADFAATSEAMYTNIAEALYDHKVRALYELGREEEAYRILDLALEEFPDSTYLARLLPCCSEKD